ncbi:MAG: OmpA family protein [Planctomycetes bacterium]|nr:OmpA family protein [Planctomycetota bacterium]
MQRFSAVIVMVLVGVVALGSIGCVDEAKYNAVLLRNREQEKLLQEKEAEIARLNERVSARAEDALRMLQEKDDHLATVMRERDTIKAHFDELMAAYKQLAGGPWAAPGALPKEVAMGIQALAAEYPGLFEFDEATGRLRFAADITFDSGSNVVKANARTAITKLGGILAAPVAKDVTSEIVGHTDSVPVGKAATKALLQGLGKSQNNQGLSEARAEAVAEILVAAGVPATRISTRGVGSSQPMADNNTPDGQAKNRRVEIYLRG